MLSRRLGAIAVVSCIAVFGCKKGPSIDPETAAQLRELRHVGKALYESPGSAEQALEQLRKAHELVPSSARDRLNFGLALLRAGQLDQGIAELVAVQQQDPTLPHTYFNLGVEYKKAGDAPRAIEQFEKMAELTPEEAKVHYNLGQLYKQEERDADARAKFELAAQLDPSLAAPRFQLYNLLRREDREQARKELDEFQRIKKLQEETGADEDVNWSFFSELYDPVEPSEAPAVAEETSFRSAELGVLEGEGSGLLTLDLDGDQDVDALAWRGEAVAVVRNDGGELAMGPMVEATGAAAAGDPNNDGFPDVCFADAAGVEVSMNDAGSLGAAKSVASGSFASCLWHDFDHDNDDDLFLLGSASKVLLNAGGELGDAAAFPFEAGKRVRAALAAELYEDNGNDLIVVYEDAVAVHQDRKLGRYDTAEAIAGVTVGEGLVRLDALDFDNDGYLDVAVTDSARTTILHNNQGTLESGVSLDRVAAFADLQNRGWTDALHSGGAAFNAGGNQTKRGETGLPAFEAAAAADFDGDGKVDLITIGPDGAVSLAHNTTPSAGKGLTVRLVGVKSAQLARGSRVEVKAGPVYRKQVYTGAPMHIGVGDEQAIDTIRVTWANGMIQNETAQPTSGLISIEEKPRLSGSCPMIFTWNGRELEYISEVLGVAPLGASLGGGRFFPVDHDEYVLIRGDQLVERDGHFEIRITEELREVAYLDQVRLIAVDRPVDLEIYTNEKFKAPPFPEFRLFGVHPEQKISPRAARDGNGRDVLERLGAIDGRYVDDFERTFRNTAEKHELILDLAGLDGRDRSMLFLTGWVDWADASTIVAGSQTRDRKIQPPLLQVRDAQGEWRTIIEDLGLPGGARRTMAVELSGKFFSASREVRILTNMCVYWDAAFAADGVADAAVEQREPPLDEAMLRFRGFSRNVVHPARLQPESFVYEDVRPATGWDPTPGVYTKFGPVEELLARIDDRYVILGAGDELALRFAADLPLPRPGWTRDYLLFVDGWAKENDANTAFGDSVEPLPFHSMTEYPYGPSEAYPDTPANRAYRETYNERQALRLVAPLVQR